jgi:hypothetical protein
LWKRHDSFLQYWALHTFHIQKTKVILYISLIVRLTQHMHAPPFQQLCFPEAESFCFKSTPAFRRYHQTHHEEQGGHRHHCNVAAVFFIEESLLLVAGRICSRIVDVRLLTLGTQ